MTALNHFGKGIWKLASILMSIIAGYIISIPFGMVNLSSVGEAGVFQLPKLMRFGVEFEPSSCIAIGILFAINSVQAIGDYSATTIGSMDRTPTGMKLVASAEMDYRNSSIVGLAAALGMGVSQASAAIATFPAWVTTIFGKSPVVLATIIAVLLNVILPKSRVEEKEEAEKKKQVEEKLEQDHEAFRK